jgi:ATP-binding cassette subfamily C protein
MPDTTDAELTAALHTVGAALALHDVVGDGGDELGATRAQQLALARPVLADPAVAVLDEATAEAGSAGAVALERAADAALAGRTAVVVAHRLTGSSCWIRAGSSRAGGTTSSSPPGATTRRSGRRGPARGADRATGAGPRR